MTINEYNYAELKATALKSGATQEDINALGEWFERFGQSYWNGEYFYVEGDRLYPINKEVAEDEYEVVGYEFK